MTNETECVPISYPNRMKIRMKSIRACIGILLICLGALSLLVLLNFINCQLSILVFSFLLIVIGLFLTGLSKKSEQEEKNCLQLRELEELIEQDRLQLRIQMDDQYREDAQKILQHTMRFFEWHKQRFLKENSLYETKLIENAKEYTTTND